MHYNFEWDPVKAKTNAEKHGVSFERAAGVFKDPMALTIYDPDNSSPEEDRWVTLGQIQGRHYLVVVHTLRDNEQSRMTVRIISARPASRQEIKQYEQG